MSEQRLSYRALLKHRAFAGFLGQSIGSRTSTTVAGLCLVWFVYESTGSAVAVGAVAIAESIAAILTTLPAGSIVDRYDRRHLVGLAHGIRAAGIAALAMLAAIGGYQLGVLVVLAVAWSATSELFRSSTNALLPDLVASGDLPSANGVVQASTSTIGAVSSALGGGLILLAGAAGGFTYAAIGYAVAAALVYLAIPPASPTTHPGATKSSGARGMLRELIEAGRWLAGAPGLLQLSLTALVFNFLFTASFTYLVVYVTAGVHGGSLLFGGALAAYAAGDVVGALWVGRTRALGSVGRVWVLGYGAMGGLLVLGLGLWPVAGFVIGGLLLMGAALGFAGNVWLTSAQNLVPTAMRGRYFAIDGLLSFISGPPAIAVGALLINSVGVLSTFVIVGGIQVASAGAFYLLAPLRNLDGRRVPKEPTT